MRKRIIFLFENDFVPSLLHCLKLSFKNSSIRLLAKIGHNYKNENF